MRSTVAALIGVSAGIALGAAGAHSLGGPERVPTPPVEDRAPVLGSAAPTLAGRPERPAHAPAAGGTVVTLDMRGLAAAAPPPWAKGPAAEVPAWIVLARTLGRSGRGREAAEVLCAVLEAGAPPGDAFGVLQSMPDGQRALACAELRACGHADAVHPWLEAMAVADGPGGFERLLAVLPEGGADFTDSVRRLALLDAPRADSTLAALAEARGWKSDGLRRVGDGFRRAGAEDIARGWETRAADAAAREEATSAGERRLALENAPDDLDALRELAVIEDGEGDHPRALRTLARALAIDAYDEDTLSLFLDLDATAAIPYVEAARDRASADLLQALARAHLSLARTAEALAVVLRLPDEAARAWWDAGAGALDPVAVLRALDRRPRTGCFARARGDALAALGRLGEAYESWVPAYESYETDEDFLLAFAAADPARAAPLLTRLHDHYPLIGPLALGALEARRLAGGSEEAGAIQRLAAKGDAAALMLVAGRGDDDALARLADQTRAHADSPDAWWRLGQAYARRDRSADAKAAWDKAIGLEPKELSWAVRRALLR